MRGTLVCAVTDGEESADAVAVGAELSERLGLRLVLAHARETVSGDGSAGWMRKQGRQGAEWLAKLADKQGVADRAERRVAVGEPAALLAQIAAEEAADAIVGGARAHGWRKRLESRLAEELESETPVPVLIAPPRARQERNGAAMNGGRANVAP